MKKLLLIFSFLCAGLSTAQTTTENYISTTDCLNENCSKKSYIVQYFDLLGRPKQVVNVQATPSGKDVVTHIEYDEFGRQVKEYLPVPQLSTGSGNYYSGPLGVYPTTYGNEKIYSEKILEKSPLQRVLQQKRIGNDWNTKPVVFGYDVNNIEDHVKKYEVVATWNSALKVYTNELLPASEYLPGQLIKNIVTDEDENKTIEFKNGQGQTILIRKAVDTSKNTDTYYVYNDYKQIAYMIPPLASVTALDPTSLNNLCYQYIYDSRNRLVEKKLPGKGWEYMVYNKADQLILTQDTVLKDKGQWLFTKYDQFGRTVYTGITNNAASRASMQNSINANANLYETRTATAGWTLNGMPVYYTNLSTPTGVTQVLSVNYYDTYPAGSPAITNVFAQPLLTDDPAQEKTTKGLLTASYVKNIEDDNWTRNFLWYDTKGRNIGSRSRNYLGGYTVINNKLDYIGVVLQTNTYHRRLGTDPEKIIVEKFTYDSQNRLLTQTHQIGSNPVEYIAQNKYNELSQLESKKVGGAAAASPLQTIDYQYNIRGWMTQINDPANLGSDLFGYKINYNQVEGLETPNSDFNDLKVKPKYNGNIAEVSWKTLTEDNEPLKRYGYVYDGLNRLSAGFYQKAGAETAKEYFEKLEYDLNGNITRLKRSEGVLPGSTVAMSIDNLKYDYSGNRLIKVTDEQQNSSGYLYVITPNTIEYDKGSITGNGNMTKHLDKGISSIEYNYLNLPNQITQNLKATSYLYRADGVKVKKLFGDLETYYLDGFQYKSTFLRESWDGEGTFIPDPNEVPELKLRIIPTSEGYYDALLNKYVYNFTDHLGNVRLSYTDTNGDGVIQPRRYNTSTCSPIFGCLGEWKPGEIVEVNNYYPFGLMHNYTATTQNAYQYKYNGKELQETGMYDYGARMYMPDLGRWGVIDAMAEKFSSLSPYNYALNSPGMVIDPDGNFAVSYSGEAAQEAFRAYRETMSVSSETSSGSSVFSGYKFNSLLDEYEIDLKTGKRKKLSNLGGNEIDFYHYINGGSQFNGRTRIVDRETGFDQWMNSSKNIKGYNHRGNNVDWDLMYDEFLQGAGPEKSLLIGKDNKAVQKLIKTQIYLDAATDFAETSMNEKTKYEASFGPWGFARENFNMQGQFMGKTNFSFYPLGNKVVIMAFDSKSVSSYSLNPFNKGEERNIPRSKGIAIPESTTHQTYIWWTTKNNLFK